MVDAGGREGGRFARVFGAVQTPGSNAPVHRVRPEADRRGWQFGSSYALRLARPLAGLLACCSARPERRRSDWRRCVWRLRRRQCCVRHVRGAERIPSHDRGGRRSPWSRPSTWSAGRRVLPVVATMGALFTGARRPAGRRAESTVDDGLRADASVGADDLPADSRGPRHEQHGRLASRPTCASRGLLAPLMEPNRAEYIPTESHPTEQGYASRSPARWGGSGSGCTRRRSLP